MTLLLAACLLAAAPKPFVMATLERTECYGTCPVYTLTILSDGQLEWEGIEHVKLVGKASAKLEPTELEALRTAFADAHYFELGSGFDCYSVTDQPSANTSFSDGKKRKAIKHYHGCMMRKGLKELTLLEDAIDRIAHTERWIK